ncbi:ANTAR domain-containing response regulator [Vibrio sinaloensis]|uniref:ANTAR domain-containing response regulator n=1 Tax=Photobacterium sp. (strain ATCC 43367) TaxID=379097 RepID=UPI00204DC161|nr:ANTAR domain-containing protein [Vibrio sinaloensis]UPQ89984.1 ANTAR domain-containing protein [Vibrio sinaloensis]
MHQNLSKIPLIICSDRVEELARLTNLLAVEFDNIVSCQLNQFESLLDKEREAHVVVGWQQPSAELRLIIEECRARNLPLLVVLKQLNQRDINRLPERMDYVLVPADTQFSLSPWIANAHQVRKSVAAFESEIEQLESRLEDRKLIERAKGLLMKLHQVDEDAAYQAMRKSAMQSSQSLAQVARNLLQTMEALK